MNDSLVCDCAIRFRWWIIRCTRRIIRCCHGESVGELQARHHQRRSCHTGRTKVFPLLWWCKRDCPTPEHFRNRNHNYRICIWARDSANVLKRPLCRSRVVRRIRIYDPLVLGLAETALPKEHCISVTSSAPKMNNSS